MGSRLYSLWQSRRLVAHIIGWKPGGPSRLAPNHSSAGPGMPGSTDGNAIASRHAIRFKKIKGALLRIDQDRADRKRLRRSNNSGPETSIKLGTINNQHRE